MMTLIKKERPINSFCLSGQVPGVLSRDCIEFYFLILEFHVEWFHYNGEFDRLSIATWNFFFCFLCYFIFCPYRPFLV